VLTKTLIAVILLLFSKSGDVLLKYGNRKLDLPRADLKKMPKKNKIIFHEGS
jgi:hypothetical protein